MTLTTDTSRFLSILLATSLVAGALAGCGDDPADAEDVVTITSPAPDGYVDDRRVTIEGTVEGDHSVEVNGYPADVQDGQWEVDVDYDRDGRVTATATAGGDEETVTFTIDTVVPNFEVHTPERGTVLDSDEHGDTVTVTGEVGKVGHSGLQLFEVNGTNLDVDEGESFETEVTVTDGFNLLSFHAIDGAHNELESNRAVVYGPLTEADSSIAEAARLDIDEPTGIDAITGIVEAYVTPDRISEYIVEGFEQEGEETIPVEINDIDWDDMSIEINPTDGILELELEMINLVVDGEYPTEDPDSDPIPGTIEIDVLVVELDLELGADDNHHPTIDVVDDELTTEGMTILIGDEEQGWLSTPAELALVYAFEEFVADLIEENLFDPAMLTQEVEFFDRQIVFTLLLEDIHVAPTGISIEMGMEFPQEKYEDVADVPGALDRPVEGSVTGQMEKPILFHTNRTAADRLLHGIWETGLFHQEVGSDDLADFTLPFELTADGLGSLLDSRIRDIHETDTPAKFGFRPLLPPVIEFTGEETATAEVGDFLLDILLLPQADGTPRTTLVVTLALHLKVELEVVIEDDEVGLDLDIEASGDVADEPQFVFDRDDTIGLITEILEVIPPLLNDELQVDAEAELEWATVRDPELQTHGNPRDRATVGVEIEAAEDFIEDDDLDDGSDDTTDSDDD